MVPGLPPTPPPADGDDQMIDPAKFFATQFTPGFTADDYRAYLQHVPVAYLGEAIDSLEDPDMDLFIDNLFDDQRTQFQTFIDVVTDMYWESTPAQDADRDCDAVPQGFADQLALAYKTQAYSDRLLAQIGGARRIKVQGRHRRTTNYAIAG